jgi:DNA-directed RNA polymerase specialized sigma24 family protein
LEKEGTHDLSRSLPQLYRFCFLMTARRGEGAGSVPKYGARSGLARFAWAVAGRPALVLSRSAPSVPRALKRRWATEKHHRDARGSNLHRCGGRVAQLDPAQLAAWISATAEPQRSALAFFYLNEFSHREMQNLLDVKMNELASLISHGRSQFQAWLNSVTEAP